MLEILANASSYFSSPILGASGYSKVFRLYLDTFGITFLNSRSVRCESRWLILHRARQLTAVSDPIESIIDAYIRESGLCSVSLQMGAREWRAWRAGSAGRAGGARWAARALLAAAALGALLLRALPAHVSSALRLPAHAPSDVAHHLATFSNQPDV